MQSAGYLTLDARARMTGAFPPWIFTNWGNDLYLFGRLRAHTARIRAVLETVDYVICECERDERLARELGFRGDILPRFLGAGGLDLEWFARLRSDGTPSRRRLLKGYQHDRGRALVGVEALRRCADALADHRIGIYSASPAVALAAELMARDTGLDVEVLSSWPHSASRAEIARHMGEARTSIGLSISDGVPNTMVEAMAMGALPIQSDTGCEREWIRDGENGLLVAPEDPQAVADALRRALTDDALVDRAAAQNAELVAQRADSRAIEPQAVALYERVAAQGRAQL
jgi:glycosyltransferase involved in cell wall biosynthesis